MHPLLQRQVKKASKQSERTGEDSAMLLLDLISDAYHESDRVRHQLERSMDIVSEEMHELHDEALKQKELAEQANRAKSHFLATMSHEIRTPMNGILGFASILKNSTLDSTQQEAVQIITDSGNSLLSILNDILDLSKIESNHLELEILEFEIEELVNSCANVFKAQAALKGIDLSIFIDPALPAMVSGDYTRLSQILNNLIGNAVKFTDTGTVGLQVLAGQTKAGQTDTSADNKIEITFNVIDTGIGFSQEIQSHLFQEFTQADSSTTRRFGGTGLGLSISQKLTHLMGGTINAESIEGKGSTFSCKIPLAPLSPPSATLYNQYHITNLHGCNILVVDDNKINRSFFTQMLKSYGLKSVAVESVQSALETLREARASGKQFDIAIIDHLMPEQDGFFLAREMRSTPAYRHIPLILSSSAGVTSLDYCKSKGFDAIAPKPVQQEHLLQTLYTLLNTDTPADYGRNKDIAGKDKSHLSNASEPASQGYILVAEDNAINQKLIQMILGKSGYSVEIADDGAEAVRMVQEYDFDLIIMDINMPNLSGREATRAIRALPTSLNQIPIIAATANAMSGDKEKCLEAGMDDYLAKPFEPEELICRIEKLLQEKKTEDAPYPEVKRQQDKLKVALG